MSQALKPDGAAEVRINVRSSTGNVYSFKALPDALLDANIRVDDPINALDGVLVYISDGAEWDIGLGRLVEFQR